MTIFQDQLMQKSKELLYNILGQRIEFKEIKGKEEVYFKADLKLEDSYIEVYIYEDEAGYMINGKDWIACEKPDFKDQPQLIEAFLGKLQNLKK